MPFQLNSNTLREFNDEVLRRYGDRPFMYFVGDKPFSYREYGEKVESLRKSLVEQGLKKGDAVALLGSASPMWAVSFMAVMTAGLVAVPIMEDFPEGDVNHIIEDSGAAAVILDLSWRKKSGLTALQNRILFSLKDLSVLENPGAAASQCDYREFLEDPAGREAPADDTGCFPVSENDVAELLYTSGTTGHSKAVLLTHRNLVTNLYEGTDLIDDCFDDQTILLSLLPMAHSFGSTSAFLSTMYKGPRICFLKRKPTPEYLQSVFREVKPTVLGGVPLIFEKIYQKKILPLLADRAFLKAAVEKVPLFRKIFHKVAGRAVLKYFGGEIRCIIIGGANFSNEVETFMRDAGIPYVLGYGLTETSPLLTFSSLKDARFGSVGRAVRNTEIRISRTDEAGTGEIEVRGPQIMKGYYRKPEETAEVLTSDGWFKTGDRGILDSDGFLFIKGRSKNVIVGNSGENIYPEVIELLLGSNPGVDEALVYQEEGQLLALV